MRQFIPYKESPIQRGFDGECSTLKNMGVDHGGFDILVPKKFLDGADTCPEPQVLGVASILQKLGGKGMSVMESSP